MGNPVVHFELSTPDAAKAREFYGTLFGWKFQVYPEMNYTTVDPEGDGKGIMGGIGQAEEAAKMVTVYVEVPDPQAALDRAVALGAKVTQEVMSIPGMVTLAMFEDPQGLQVGLVGEATPPAG